MLIRLTVRNFKRFEEVVIDLDSPVLFIGPNNSGKTTALQALALWDLGIRRWREKRQGKGAPEKRPGVAISHRDLVTSPSPDAKHLWRNLRVRNIRRVDGKQRTENIRIDIVVEGRANGQTWTAGLEFDFANEETFHCRPLRVDTGGRMPVPEVVGAVRFAYLPPMSGLATSELRLEPGGVQVRLGEGRTAEVLRNLCLLVHQERPEEWSQLVADVEQSFGARLDPPRYLPERGEIAMSYREGGVRFDITSAGRGLQQTTLLLAHLALNPGAVLILDEPDAHLEVVRQRGIYELLIRTAERSGSQIIAASHSEVLLQEAAGRDAIVAFLGSPHRIENTSQVVKALRDIGYGDYERARQAGCVVYVEGTTDPPVLRAFAKRLGHERALEALERSFVRAVGNRPTKALDHYYGLREANPELRACAIFDRLEQDLPEMHRVPAQTWRRREIENYLSSEQTLLAWAEAPPPGPPTLFTESTRKRRYGAMKKAILEVREAALVLRPGLPPDSEDAKASEDFLEPVFKRFFQSLGQTDRMPKRRFHELVPFIPDTDLDSEISEKLDLIADTYDTAQLGGV
jgi:hypothetical protein